MLFGLPATYSLVASSLTRWLGFLTLKRFTASANALAKNVEVRVHRAKSPQK